MKKILLFITTLALLAFPKVNFGQAPTLGTTSSFALFTASGAFDNNGASVITGDIGSFTYIPVGFPIPGTVVGNIYNVGAPILTSAAADVATAFGNFSAAGSVMGTPLETYNTTGFIYPGTYHTVGAAVLNGDFTLDAQGDPNALFVININGALAVAAGVNILLINSASLCNVYWQINGDFTLGAGSVFRGTILSSGAITLFEGASLLGRGLTKAGAISLHNNVVTVNSLPAAAGTINGTATVCKGQNGLIYSVANINNASSYLWTLPAGASIVAGALTNSITVDFSGSAVSGNITVQGANACANGTVSANFAVTVNPSTAAVAGSNRAICLSTSTQIGGTAVVGSTYRWSSVPAGFTSTEANPTVTPMVTTTYTVTESIPSIVCSNSNSVVVTVNTLPSAIAGNARAICSNDATTLGASAVTGSTYSWTSIPAGFSSTQANPTVTPLVSTTYTVVETITATGCTNRNNVVVSVNPKPAAIAGANKAICNNESTSIGAVAVIGNTYSWSSVPAGFTSNEANPKVSPLVTTTYTVVETSNGCSNSNSVVITISPVPAAVAGANRSICQDENIQIGAATVVGSTYSWSSAPAGFTSSISNPTVKPIGTTTYTVVETTTAGCTSTHSVVVTVYPAPAAIAGSDRTICLKETTQIGAAAVTGSTYKWSSVPAGFTSSLANPTVNPNVTTTYSVVETSVNGCKKTNSVTVALNTVPTIVTEPTDQTTCVGSSVSFSVTATGTSLTYQWRKGTVALNNGGNISGATSATLSINAVKTKDAASDYNVLITGICSTNETSNNVSLEVNAAPGISTSACVGSSVSFSATATGAGLTYQWRKGTVDLTDGGNITGANSSTLTINPVNASDASSNYNVLITGTCSPEATSLNIGLVVNTAMSITAEPTNQVACVGNSAIFKVGAAGTGLTYQWKKGTVTLVNGANISGATSATLVINPVTATDVASDYHVVITGPCSAMVTSKPVSLSLCIPDGTSSLKAGDINNVVTIYPNPFTSSIDVKVMDASKIDNYELRLYNVSGEEVLNTHIINEITTVVTSKLAPGVYTYRLKSNNETIQSGKLISQK